MINIYKDVPGSPICCPHCGKILLFADLTDYTAISLYPYCKRCRKTIAIYKYIGRSSEPLSL